MEKIALLFAGQGAQVVGMGKDLSERFPTARALFEEANAALGFDLTSLCTQGPESELTRTENAQPAIYLVGWVAFQLLREHCPSLDVQATAGLSLGEFTALAAGGSFSWVDGLKIVQARGRFMQEACDGTRGTMAAIMGLEEEAMRGVCDQAGVALANLNCPGQIVISGEMDRIIQACELAKAQGAKRALPLNVAGAYHSPLMASAQPKLAAVLERISWQSAQVPVMSNVTARPHGETTEILPRLVEQVTSPVRWEASMRYLLCQGFTRFIELGPGTALTGFMKRIDKSAQVCHVADGASLESTVQTLASHR